MLVVPDFGMCEGKRFHRDGSSHKGQFNTLGKEFKFWICPLRIFIADDLRETKKACQNAASKKDPVLPGTLSTKTGLLAL